jgi:hypothetical protein
MSHTPGPWTHDDEGSIENLELCPSLIAIINGEAQDYGYWRENIEEWKDNARLIAAAPDLLEALQAILKHPHVQAYLPYDPTDPVFLGAVKAIKKATGG